ncbi:MAG: ISNCY family transposase, partial [Nostoc sp.]
MSLRKAKTLVDAAQSNPATLDTFSIKHWKGKVYEIHNYRYVNQIPLKDGEDALLVNWCELTITRDDGTLIYKNNFATNHQITEINVE